MDFLGLVAHNFLSPAILFFLLGMTAGLIKSDLQVPDSISRYLSLYLMMSIGFKGGVAIANTPDFTPQILETVILGVAGSFLLPFIAYGFLRSFTGLDSPTAAAVAAHYGSISMVTFATAVAFLKARHLPYEGYIVAILALMEGPAIMSGLFIAHRSAPQTAHPVEEKRLRREIFTNGSILLLFGAFVIGWITGEEGMTKLSGFLDDPFQGILCLFLLDMGILVATNFGYLRDFSSRLVIFGYAMPVIGAFLGLTASYGLNLDVGTGFLFTVLWASASYIAVPAAMRLALPEAKAAIYLPLSLGITFPFNVTVGVPLYFLWASKIL